MKGVVSSIMGGIVALLVSCADAGGGLCAVRGDQRLCENIPEQRARLLFVGDAMCHSPQIFAARQVDGSLDFRKSFSAIKPYFDRADIAVVNLETTISPDGRYSGYPSFSSPKEYAEALAWVGADVALLANNHCCDRGARGLRTTVATLEELGCMHTGAFADSVDYRRNRVLRFEKSGIRFALVNYTYGTNGLPTPQGCVVNLIDTVRMAAELKSACEGADCVVACMHWGEEYSRKPSREQSCLADFLHRNGVDIVVGSHPHVVQPAKATEHNVTIYSLGNFISNQRKRYCDGGVVAEVDITKEGDGQCRYSLRITPVWVAMPGYRLLTPESADAEIKCDAQRSAYEQFMRDTESLFMNGMNSNNTI